MTLDLSWSSYCKRGMKMSNTGMRRLLCMCGAGGTGKTVVLRLLERAFAERGVKTHTFLSVVRSFYAMNGLKDQADYMAQPPEIRRSFQIQLQDYYMLTLRKCLHDHPDALILSDRSPFCHNAYAINGIVDISLAEYREYWARVCEFAAECIALGVFFPYPQPWTQDVDPDAFRLAHPHQNLSIDALMYRGFMRRENHFPRLVLPETGDPDSRAVAIVDRYLRETQYVHDHQSQA